MDKINFKNNYEELKKRLIEEKNFIEQDFYFFENNQTSFNMNYYNIKTNDILNDLEAKIFNSNINNLTENLISKSLLIEYLKLSVEEQITKKQKIEKNNKTIINQQNDNKLNIINHNINPDSNNKTFTKEEEIQQKMNSERNDNNNVIFKYDHKNNIVFKIISTFDENNNSFSQNRNDSEIKLNFFEEKITEEYQLVPSNDSIFLEQYKLYFANVKESFKENYFSLIGQQSDTFGLDKFILLVIFENTDGKPSYKDIGFFDPLNNFKKYSLREEDFSNLRDYYFFNGQIVLIEGEVDNNNMITLKDLRKGFVPDLYNLDYQYIMSFFKNVIYLYKILECSILHICNEWSLLFKRRFRSL